MPIVARLKPGVSAAAAEPIVDAAYREHMSTPGIGFGRTRDGRFILSAAIVPAARGADRLRREYEPTLRVLTAIVFVVLLIACVNVANLFLARGEARAGEVVMRLAVGASRWRIVRQLLTEAGIVALAGGLVGFAAAAWATRSFAALLVQSQRPVSIDGEPDGRVFAFTLAAAGLATLLFGLVPALRAAQSSLRAQLPRTASTTTGRRRGRVVLVAAQLALCVVLVFGAGLLVRTLRNLQAVDNRFASDGVVAFALDANDSGFPLERMGDLCTQAIDRLRQPGVIAASCSTMTPLDTAREVRTLGLPALAPGARTAVRVRPLALVLAAVGIYGVIAYDVARRTREIGIRLALGAFQRTVVAAVLRQTAAIVVPGVAVGLGGAVTASSLVDTFLFGITRRDPVTLATTTLVLGAIAVIAAYLPARRAARVNPAIALRAE